MSDFARYIKSVFDHDDIVEFRLIRKGYRPEQSWQHAQDCPALESEFNRRNRQGWNIHAGVNPRIEFDKSGDNNVRLARWLFADFDHIEPGDGCGRWEFISDRIYRAGLDMPDMVVSSGNGLHTYWKLAEPLTDMEQWREIQERLIITVGSDKAIKNPERIMRTPGFQNMKDTDSPKDCFIIYGA